MKAVRWRLDGGRARETLAIKAGSGQLAPWFFAGSTDFTCRFDSEFREKIADPAQGAIGDGAMRVNGATRAR
jgi:hypothetical protein